jgi:hypothetical protein
MSAPEGHDPPQVPHCKQVTIVSPPNVAAMTRSPKLRPFKGFIMALLFLKGGIKMSWGEEVAVLRAQQRKFHVRGIQIGCDEYPTYETFSLG